MKSPNHETLEAFLAQKAEQHEARAKRVELPDPAQWHAEQQTLLALLATPHQAPADELSSPSRLRSLWQRLWSPPFSWAPLATTAVMVLALTATLSAFWLRTPISQVAKPSLFPKGRNSVPTIPPAVLQVGLWQPSSQKIAPLSSGQQLSSQESLVFGIQLTQAEGYLYLFHERARKPSQIFPMPGHLPTLRRAVQAVQLLQHEGIPQRYTLTNERGLQRFLLLLAKKPLSQKEIKRWQQQYEKQALWDLQPSLSKVGLHEKIRGWDAFHLYITQ